MSLSDYESTLTSYIHDDDKLVTYKWLSQELEMHVNVAKDVLKQYWEKHKSKGDIVATYLLIGQLKDGSIRVEVVKETNLDAARDKYVKVDCQHLYSLQKCLPDIELLALVGGGDLRYSAIKCNEEFVRDEDEIDDLRYIGIVGKGENKSEGSNNAASKVSNDKTAPKATDSVQSEKVDKSNDQKSKLKEKERHKEKEQEAEKTKSEDKNSAPTKKTSPPKKVLSPSKTAGGKGNDKSGKKPLQSKQSGFNQLFGKVQSKPVSAESKKLASNDEKDKSSTGSTNKTSQASEQKKEEKKVQEKENKKNNQGKDDKKPSEDKSKTITKSDSKVDSKTKSKSNTSNKKRQRSQEKNTSSKRKRIIVVDSSEDENSRSENEEEEPMEVEEEPPKPVRKRSPSPPAEKRENGKRMVRKTIDKTYKDEDGYLVTKTVHVYEPAEDNDEECKIVQPPPSKPKPVDNKTKKQTTLISFFKKP